MKTKTPIFGIIAILTLVMFASSLVLAQENSTSVVSNATQVSSGKIFWKEVGLWFTFNQEKKIQKEMELADLRLEQAEYAIVHNRTKDAQKALDSYERLVDRANKRSELIKSKDTTNANILKLAAMDQAILVHQNRIEKISSYLATGNLTEDERAKLEEKLTKAQNITSHLQEVQLEKEEKLKTRLMAEGNLSEEESEEKINEAKDNADEVVKGAKEAWKDFKDEAKSNNMTPKELAKEKRQEFKSEIKNEFKDSKPKGSPKSN